MKSKDLIFIAIIAGVVGIFVFLSAIGRKPPALTARPEHAGLTDKTPNDTCLACHAPDSTVAPMPVHHPKKGRPPDKMPCAVCHKIPHATPALQIHKPAEVENRWLNQLLN